LTSLRVGRWSVLLVGLLGAPQDSGAQGTPESVGFEIGRFAVECGDRAEVRAGVVWGRVQARNDQGTLWGHGPSVPAYPAIVMFDGDECKAYTNQAGFFAAVGLVPGTYELEARWIGWPAYRGVVHVEGDTVRIDVQLTAETVGHEFSRFLARPKVVADPAGIEGCYWLGGTPHDGKVIKLESNGVVQGWSPNARWEEVIEPRAIKVSSNNTMWGEDMIINIGGDPDWSDLHLRYSSWSDHGLGAANRPLVWESFATRVACREWGYDHE